MYNVHIEYGSKNKIIKSNPIFESQTFTVFINSSDQYLCISVHSFNESINYIDLLISRQLYIQNEFHQNTIFAMFDCIRFRD